MGFKSGLNRVLLAPRARGLRIGAEKATDDRRNARASVRACQKTQKQTLLRRISRAARRLEQQHEARIDHVVLPHQPWSCRTGASAWRRSLIKEPLCKTRTPLSRDACGREDDY